METGKEPLATDQNRPQILEQPAETVKDISPLIPLPQTEQEELTTIRSQIGETNPLTQENVGTVIPESLKLPEKKSFLQLIELGKKPEEAKKYFSAILNQEYQEKRLTKAQYRNFIGEINTFAFDRTVKDFLITNSINVGYLVGLYAGLINEVGVAGALALVSALSPLPINISGFFRAPYCIYRSIQEFRKLKEQEGQKAALKSIPFFAGINLLNFVKIIGPLAPLLLSFPRNKDVGLALVNNRVQTSRSPRFIKRFVNWGTQKLFEKPKTDRPAGLQLHPAPA